MLDKAEINYCVTRRELLAVIDSEKNFHRYLIGRQFIVRIDHATLTWLLSLKEPENQLSGWIEFLEQYNYKIEHGNGKLHGNADGLSRHPCTSVNCKDCAKVENR